MVAFSLCTQDLMRYIVESSLPDLMPQLKDTAVTYVDVYDAQTGVLTSLYRHSSVMMCESCTINTERTLIGTWSVQMPFPFHPVPLLITQRLLQRPDIQ